MGLQQTVQFALRGGLVKYRRRWPTTRRACEAHVLPCHIYGGTSPLGCAGLYAGLLAVVGRSDVRWLWH
jgi:hypothetical protein